MCLSWTDSFKNRVLSAPQAPPPSVGFHCWPSQGGISVFLSPLSCSIIFFPRTFHCCCIYCLVRGSSIVAICPSIPAARFAFVCVLLFYLFCFCCSYLFCLVNRSRTKGEGRQAPSNFIAVRPKAALLFWFFGNFRFGMLLFMVI